ncbi:MAG: KH domain-containing protein [Caldilineae bacterium]|nr:MAG: KH domain-containing protein [Caldilineae bacterium]
MRDLITYIARSVVTNPDAVQVQEKHRARNVTLYLKVAPSDMGRVIGKQGRMANAMRTLLRVAAVKEGKQVTLEIGR